MRTLDGAIAPRGEDHRRETGTMWDWLDCVVAITTLSVCQLPIRKLSARDAIPASKAIGAAEAQRTLLKARL
jgi:hypothetical protein